MHSANVQLINPVVLRLWFYWFVVEASKYKLISTFKMSFFILRRSCSRSSSILSQNPNLKPHLLPSLFSSQFSTLHPKRIIPSSGCDSFWKYFTGFPSFFIESFKIPSGNFSSNVRLFGSQAAVEPSTSDGLTVEGIIANQWTIFDESESDWKSHASSIAQSIHLIKKRLKVNPVYGYQYFQFYVSET